MCNVFPSAVFRPRRTRRTRFKRAFKSFAEYFWRLSRRRPLLCRCFMYASENVFSSFARQVFFENIYCSISHGEKITFPLAQGKYVRFGLSKHVRVSLVRCCTRTLDTVSYRSNFLLRVNGTIDRRIQGTVDTRCSSYRAIDVAYCFLPVSVNAVTRPPLREGVH